MSSPTALVTRLAPLVLCLLALSGGLAPLAAQQDTGFDTSRQWVVEQIEKNHVRLKGNVEAVRGDMTFHADEIESFTDTHRVIATGHVVFRQGENWISADRAEFNTETRLGTFFNATGGVVIGDAAKRDMLGGQEPDISFYGERIEKVGPKKYKITKGAFTTCLQPTPRWEVSSGTVVLNLDHYAFLRNAVLKAKGLPVLYLPVLYYPINKEDRATGFLMPAYGTSTYRGFSLSNGFFWAINRSQDATFLHDWFSKRGQGMGAEYRYVGGPGSQGNARFYHLREHEAVISNAPGQTTTLPAGTSYDVKANLSQPLGGRWAARGRVDYFTDVTVQQTYHTNIYDASRSQRTIAGSVSGAIGQFNVNGSYDRREYFAGASETTLTGATPRIQINRGEKPIPHTPIYFSVSGEYAGLRKEFHREEGVTDSNVTRLDFSPAIRVPFTRLRWLTVNSSLSWRDTWWTRSRLAGTNDLIDDGISRRYAEFSSRVVGPVLNRVWNTPDNGYAEKFKHTVEPYVQVNRSTSVDNFDEIIQNDGNDSVVGGTTRVDYGVTNRFLAKRRGGGAASSSREFLNIGVSQTYYTDVRASQYDPNYSTSFSGLRPSNFSAISLVSRVSPTDEVNGSLRLEFDHEDQALRSLSANGQVAVAGWLNVTGGYSHRRVENPTDAQAGLGAAISRLADAAVEGTRVLQNAKVFRVDNSVNAATSLRTPGNRLGGSYTFDYDIGRSALLSSRIIGYYNAQCCGFAVEYQTVTYPTSAAFPIKQDNRFNFSFTLAGLGTFSNFFGALGGNSR